MKQALMLLIAWHTLAGAAAPTVRILYVDGRATGAENGSSWQDAFTNPVYAMDSFPEPVPADMIYEVRVAQGVYAPGSGSTVRYAFFWLTNRVELRGGYAGLGAPDPDARDIAAYETVLSGDMEGNDVPVANLQELLTHKSREENCYHVINASGTDASAVIDGFTVTGGNANGRAGHDPDDKTCGGGFFCHHKGNSDTRSSTTVMNCRFVENAASNRGGGFLLALGSPVLVNCTFERNWAGWDGGGMKLEDSNPVLTGCTFRENAAGLEGGGLNSWESEGALTNCSFWGNTAGENAGALKLWYSFTVELTNCTIAGNSAGALGGGLHLESDRAVLANCIFWNNADQAGQGESSQIGNKGGTVEIAYSCVQGWTGDLGGAGSMGDDPLLSTVAVGDLRLLPGSPAIDAGTPDGAPDTDIEGCPRPAGAGYDMGAHEYGACGGGDTVFRRGDSDADGGHNIGDAIFILQYLFANGQSPPCLTSADTTDDGAVNLADAIYLLSYLFANGPEPPPPFPACGTDPTPDSLDCPTFEPCQGR